MSVDIQELRRLIQLNWRLPSGCQIRRVSAGATNEVYRIEAEHLYFLRAYRSTDRERVRSEHQLLHALSANLSEIVAPLKTTRDETVVVFQSRYFALFPAAFGHQICQQELTADKAFDAGRMLATLHHYLNAASHLNDAFPTVTLVWEKNEWLSRFDRVIDALQQRQARSLFDEQALERAITQRRYLATHDCVHQYHPTSRRQLIHGDFHLLNLFYHEGSVTGVIDWDLTQNMPVGYEIARACQYICDLEPSLSLALIKGYMASSSLDADELADGVRAWAVFSDHHIWAFEQAYFQGNEAARQFIPQQPFRPFLARWQPIQQQLIAPVNERRVTGLDEQGFIAPAYSVSHIPSEFEGVVAHTLQCLERQFPNQIHSVYLYGSVARGDAIPGLSDLDLSLVFHQPLTQETHTQLATLAQAISAEFSVISKLDFDPGNLADVLSECEEYRWQFWLKHYCCCLWGEDLSLNFRCHKPSIRFASTLNSDLASVLSATLQQLPKASPVPQPAKAMAKKLLRSAYLLVAERDQSWLSDLHQIADVLKRYYPDDLTSIDIALQLSLGENRNVLCINELITSFGYKISEKIAEIQD